MRLDGCTQTEPIFREFGCAIFWPYWTSAALCMKLGHVARSEHLLQGTNVCTQTEPMFVCGSFGRCWQLGHVGQLEHLRQGMRNAAERMSSGLV